MADTLTTADWLARGPALAFAGLLGVPLSDHRHGLPPLWHGLYALPRVAQADLGPDGHPLRGAVPLPPSPGLRRMFAGGSVTTMHGLAWDAPVLRRAEIVQTQQKSGRTGEMTFVQVAVSMTQFGDTVIRERQDIVYREPAHAAGVREPVKHDGPVREAGGVTESGDGDQTEWRIRVDPTLLFRFSALTYNAHRIHYDREFAQAEGYAGLVVHGPFQALVMAEAARSLIGDAWTASPTTFDYRLLAPLTDQDGLVCVARRVADAVDVEIYNDRKRLTARGRLSLIPVD